MLTADILFDLSRFAHAGLFSEGQPVWSALQRLKGYLDDLAYPRELFAELGGGIAARQHLVLHDGALFDAHECLIEFGDTLRGGLLIRRGGEVLEGASLLMAGSIFQGDRIAIGRGVLVEGGATIKAPAVIGERSEIRQGAYLRGYCLVGARCVVGHATEMKHSILLDDAKAGHFAYLGDSIVGNDANLGAGTKCANLRFIPGTVKIGYQGAVLDSGLRKLGAILGDGVQTGCNSVTSPGTIMARQTFLMPNATVPSGFHDRHRIG